MALTYNQAMDYVSADFSNSNMVCDIVPGNNEGVYIQAFGRTYRINELEIEDSRAAECFKAIVMHSAKEHAKTLTSPEFDKSKW